MTEFAPQTSKIPYQKLISSALTALALGSAAAETAGATTGQPAGVVSSKPQRTSHLIAEKIIVPPELKVIGGCESGGGANSKGNYKKESRDPKSSASGYYQILDTTWWSLGGKGRAKNAPPWKQDKLAVKLLKRDGLSPWYASRSCWAGKVALIKSKR